MTEIKWRDFRENLADIINRVRFHNERVAITRHGKIVAELGPSTGQSAVIQASGEGAKHSSDRLSL